jgi:hypothetical protein
MLAKAKLNNNNTVMSFLERFHSLPDGVAEEIKVLAQSVLELIEGHTSQDPEDGESSLIELKPVEVPDPRDEGDQPRMLMIQPDLNYSEGFRQLTLDTVLPGKTEHLGYFMKSVQFPEGCVDVSYDGWYYQAVPSDSMDAKWLLEVAQSVLRANTPETPAGA